MRVLAFSACVFLACGGQTISPNQQAEPDAASGTDDDSGSATDAGIGTGSSSSGSASGSSGSNGGSSSSSSGAGSGSSGGGSGGSGGPSDVFTNLPPPWDASIADGTIQDATFDVAPAPAGLAGFAFVVNGIVQTPMTCAAADWEYPTVPGEGPPPSGYPPTAGVTSAYIVNTGTLPMPYVAQSYWNPVSHGSVPGASTGISFQLAGVLQPGEQVDITAVYIPGIVALLGSAEPFSPSSAPYAADEGTIPWPQGVAGSGGATTMYVAEIEVPVPFSNSGCVVPNQVW